MLSLRRAVVMLLAATLIASCGYSDPTLGCAAVRAQYPKWPDARWRTYDLETQYRVYMCANQGVLPHRGGETELAAGGAEMGHFLARKLEATDYDLTIFNIVSIFAVMQSMRTFDATTDPALMTLLERKVASLTRPEDHALREQAERDLQTIKAGPGAALR